MGMKKLQHENADSSSSSVHAKNEWSCTSTAPHTPSWCAYRCYLSLHIKCIAVIHTDVTFYFTLSILLLFIQMLPFASHQVCCCYLYRCYLLLHIKHVAVIHTDVTFHFTSSVLLLFIQVLPFTSHQACCCYSYNLLSAPS